MLLLLGTISRFRLVRLDVKVGEHDEENDGVQTDPVDKQRRVVALYEQQLYRVDRHQDKLGL
jgi:hypothetical protein